MLQGSVLSYDWYKTGEGQGLMAHFIDPKTGNYSIIAWFPNYSTVRIYKTCSVTFLGTNLLDINPQLLSKVSSVAVAFSLSLRKVCHKKVRERHTVECRVVPSVDQIMHNKLL